MTMTMPIQEQCQGDSSKQSTTAPPEPLTATTATPPTAKRYRWFQQNL